MSQGHVARRTRSAGIQGQMSRLAHRKPGQEIGEAEHSTSFKWLVRTGFLARGMTYGLVGALALALAFGAGTAGTKPDQQGSLELIARAPFGSVVLVVIAVGLLAYAIWKFSQAFFGRGPEGGGGSDLAHRAINAGGGVAYLLFCTVAVEVLAGSGGGSSGSPRSAAGGVLAWPGGQWIVGIAGAGLLAGCLYQAYYALSEKFTEQDKTSEMNPAQQRRFRLIGKVGLMGRAVVFALIGYFLVESAVNYDPGNAVGVDGALSRLHHTALGPWLVGLVGVGLIVFATFSLYEARYRRL